MEFISRCFYCGAPSQFSCRECGLVGVCGDTHLSIHRQHATCLPFAVHHSQDKGAMVVAVRDLEPGETVLIDTPFVVGKMSEDIEDNIQLTGKTVMDVLAREDRQHFMDLESHLEDRRSESIWSEVLDHIVPWVKKQPGMESTPVEIIEKIIGIIRTNSIKWSQPCDGSYLAVCPVFARLNHSCCSNAADIQTDCGSMVVRTLTRVEQGQEVTIQYRSGLGVSLTRRRELMDYWRFTCTCDRCQDITEQDTLVSGVKCDTCPGFLLPATCSLTSDWRCQQCDAKSSHEEILNLILLSQKKFSTITKSSSINQIIDLLSELQLIFHPNHSLCLHLERVLIFMIGDEDQYLNQKIKLCRRYINIMSKLEPGYRTWLGPIASTLAKSLTQEMKNDATNNNLDKAEYVSRIKEIFKWKKTSEKCQEIFQRKL